MSTDFTHEQRFTATPVEVVAMMTDPEYVQHKSDSTGSIKTGVDVTPEDDQVTVVNSRVMPADVPASVKSFVGDTIKVTETQVWNLDDQSAKVDVSFGGPLSFAGTITLSAEGAETIATTVGTFKATVPFVGGTIEEMASDQTKKYLRAEEKAAAEWLSR
jgi:hypothetical protein